MIKELSLPIFDPTGNPVDGYGLFSKEIRPGSIDHQLASGEQLITQELGANGKNSLVKGLVEYARQRVEAEEDRWFYSSPDEETQRSIEERLKEYCDREARKRVRQISSSVLGRYNDFGKGDASYWARKIADGDSVAERFLPHWVFLSIVAGVTFDYPFIYHTRDNYRRRFWPEPPRLYRLRPSDSELGQSGLTQKDLMLFSETSSPSLIGKAIPIFGWYDWYNCRVQTRFTLLRESTGLGKGLLTLPGGHAKHLLDFAAWRELQEEEDLAEFKEFEGGYWWIRQEEDVISVTHAAVIDQILIDPQQQLKHFMINVFSFDLRLGGLAGELMGKQTDEILKHHVPSHRDNQGKNDFRLYPFDRKRKELQQDLVRGKLGPVEELAIESIRNQIY